MKNSMELKNKEIVVYKGEIGTVHRFTDEKCFRFASLKNKPSYMKNKEVFPIVDPDEVREANIDEKDQWLLSETKWLGEPIKVHKIGDYQIVEYDDRDNDGKLTGEHCFTTYIDYKSCGYSYGGLDESIVGCIAYKYEGSNRGADRYFMKMIKQEGDK